MGMRLSVPMSFIVPMIAALGFIAMAPSAAQAFPRYGYDQQGGGGAGPYDLRCWSFHNYNQRQRCTQMYETYGYGYRYYAPRRHWAYSYPWW